MKKSTKRPAMSIKEQKFPAVHSESAFPVNASELHKFLDLKEPLRDWFPRMLTEFRFEKDIDYQSLADLSAKPQGGRTKYEWALTLDMAKEVSMLSRTEKGRLVRKYFIEVEKAARQNSTGHVINVINEYEQKIETLIERRKSVAAEIKKLRAAQKDVIKNPYKQIGIIPFPNKKEVANG